MVESWIFPKSLGRSPLPNFSDRGGWDGSISAVITNNVEESDWPVDTLTSQHLYSIVQDTRPRVLHIINIWEIFANGNHALAHDMAWRDSGSRPI